MKIENNQKNNPNLYGLIISEEKALKDAMIKINKNGLGVCFVVDKDEKLSNFLSDGDIRRYLINGFQKVNKQKITEITSPTFNLLNEYQINHIKIKHYDLFRLKSEEEIRNLDLFDDSSNIIILIEWPQIIKKKPKNLIELNFEYGKDHQERSVQIKGLIL